MQTVTSSSFHATMYTTHNEIIWSVRNIEIQIMYHNFILLNSPKADKQLA